MPEKSGWLMRIYFFWSEAFSPAGHIICALLLFGAFFLFAPGFFPLKCLELFFAVSLFLALLSRRKPKNRILRIEIPQGTEGVPFRLSALFEKPLKAGVFWKSFRMDSSLESLGDGTILPHRRGVFQLPRIALVERHPSGLVQSLKPYGKTVELLVAPKIFPLKSFAFLTAGKSGARFERCLRPENCRGQEFYGVREYRDGDSLRDLHYRAFARYGRPFTKEYEKESGGGIVLLLDVSATHLYEKMCVEAAIRLCGSVAFWLLERGALSRFFIGGKEVPLKTPFVQREILKFLAEIPRAEIWNHYELDAWNGTSVEDSPILSVSLRRVPWKVDKQIVVVDKTFAAADGDEIKFVCAGREDLL